MKRIVITAPVYNEAEGILKFLGEIEGVVTPLLSQYEFQIVLVDDGSRDATVERLRQYAGALSVTTVRLARNFGHPTACAACLAHAEGDAVILMDSDLQDDPAAIPAFLAAWEAGHQVVYAVRESRQEPPVQRICFSAFYHLIRWVADIELPLNSGNFSLMDRCVVEAINRIPEKHRYLPGIRAYIGFKQTGVPIARRRRYDKSTRVGWKGLFRLAFNGIFSFSHLPIRIFHLVGALALLICLLLGLYVLVSKVLLDIAFPAWSSQMLTTLFFGAVNLLGIGILGEYLARIHDQVKGYPQYTILETFSCGPPPKP